MCQYFLFVGISYDMRYVVIRTLAEQIKQFCSRQYGFGSVCSMGIVLLLVEKIL